MQYYRLWIYSANSVLGLTSAIFTVFAAFVLADVRLSLLEGVELYHPTFLYAYAALILQCGVVQTIGCLGAQRLSHKLLSVYWILLLLLTIGDVVVGLVWVFKLDKVKLSLQKEALTREFLQKYSIDASFTYSWNKVQAEEHCCGVEGPYDYRKSSNYSDGSHDGSNTGGHILVPSSCCASIQYLPPELLVDTSASNNLYNHPNHPNPNPHLNNHHHHRHHQHSEHHSDHHHPHHGHNDTNLTRVVVSEVNESDVSSSGGHHPVTPLPLLFLTSNNNNGSTIVGHSGPTDRNEDPDGGTVPTSAAAFNTNLLNSHNNINNNNIGFRHKPRHSGRRKTHGSGGLSLSSSSSSFSAENQTLTPERGVVSVGVGGGLGGTVTGGGGGGGGNGPRGMSSPPTPESVKGGPSSSSKEAININIPSPWSCQNHVLLQSSVSPDRRRRHKGDEGGGESSSSDPGLAQMLMNSPTEQNKSLSLSSSSSSSFVSGGGREEHDQQQLDSRMNNNNNNNNRKYRVYSVGCQVKLIEWVDHVSGIMFILGFCIIGFVKACFLVILRYELREMIVVIEKIQVLETEAPISPSRNCNFQGGGRGEYGKLGLGGGMSGTNAITSNFSGITIKSPQGDGGGSSNFCRSDRSTSHSQETVNMTLLITPKIGGMGGLDPNPKGGREMKQYRSHSQGSPFFDYTLGNYFGGVERADDHNVLIRIPHTTTQPKPVKKDLSFSSCSSVAQPPTNRTGFHHQVSSENNSDICELLLASVDVENFAYEDEAHGTAGGGAEGVNWKQGSSTGTAPYRRNGNNNIKTSNSFTLALLGTAV